MTEEQIIIPMPMTGGGSVPVPPKVDRADFVDKIKPEMIIDVIRHKLLGEEWDGAKWHKVPGLQKNALSERGAWEISTLMFGSGGINTSISKLTSQQISARLRGLSKELMIKMLGCWKEYGITDASQFYYIHSILFSNALAVLSQAGDGSIQELFKTTVQENRNVTTTPPEQTGRLRRMFGMV